MNEASVFHSEETISRLNEPPQSVKVALIWPWGVGTSKMPMLRAKQTATPAKMRAEIMEVFMAARDNLDHSSKSTTSFCNTEEVRKGIYHASTRWSERSLK